MPSCRSQGRQPHTIGPHLYRHEAATPSITSSAWPPAWIPWWSESRKILGHAQAAYAAAKESGAVRGWLEGLLARAFGVAKRVRSETASPDGRVGELRAVELARKIFRIAR